MDTPDLSERTPLRFKELQEKCYNSDSAMYHSGRRESPRHNVAIDYHSSGSDEGKQSEGESIDQDDLYLHLPSFNTKNIPFPVASRRRSKNQFHPIKDKNRTTKRSRIRNLNRKYIVPSSKEKLRVSAYCTCDQLLIFKLMKWLERTDTGQLLGGELSSNGWKHKLYMGVVHSVCIPDGEEEMKHMKQKDVFYFANGCTVFWGLSRAEEQDHVNAIAKFASETVQQVEIEDMDFQYGDSCRIVNDSITLTSTNPFEKLALSFAMAQSAKLDVFEERVEQTIKQTKHIPEDLAATGSIEYSQTDISKLIGRLFIERNDVNLNSDMLDEPDFFWEYDEWEPLYRKMMRYLDVENRVQILNARLDILRELLDVLSQQLANQHASKLEWIIIWLILAEVVVQVVWNMLIKDILGFFPSSITS